MQFYRIKLRECAVVSTLNRYVRFFFTLNRCLMLGKPVTTCMGNGCSPAVAGDVFGGVIFCAVLLFTRDVLDEIWD